MPASVYGTIYEGGGVNSLLQSLVSEFSFSTSKNSIPKTQRPISVIS